jgi:acetyl-CoA synthetase
MSDSQPISSTLQESRKFTPRPAADLGFPRWHVSSLDEYKALHAKSLEDPEGYWASEAGCLSWFKRWETVLDWRAPDAKWFVGGQLNACYNCVDRHVTGRVRR